MIGARLIGGALLGLGTAGFVNLFVRKRDPRVVSAMVCGTTALAYFALTHHWYDAVTTIAALRLLFTPVLGIIAGLVLLLCAYGLLYVLGTQGITTICFLAVGAIAGSEIHGFLGGISGVLVVVVIHSACSVALKELESDTKRSRLLASLLTSLFITLVLGRLFEMTGVGEIPFTTTVDYLGLRNLTGKTVAILPVQFNDKGGHGGMTDAGLIEHILTRYENAFASQKIAALTLKPMPGPYVLPTNFDNIRSEDRITLHTYLDRENVAGAFLTRCTVGITSGDDDGWIWLACDTLLIDRNGKDIWRFYGKSSRLGSLNPLESIGRSLNEISDSRSLAKGQHQKITDAQPTPPSVKAGLESLSDNFAPFVAWLVEQDCIGRSQKNYYVDYKGAAKDPTIAVYPAHYELPPRLLDAPGF